jgi:hypothetical protein
MIYLGPALLGTTLIQEVFSEGRKEPKKFEA